ncbi:hypothetical protein HQQ94_21260 [Shewanella sp. VB17]|uniref:hypothetical protein n=1 Tax=Shewanella sp. VB17 TaxID=2739432 RepID=UPI0015631D4A|nr:hypothetical protein [Shewanella sp. VB17]NRD75701.1 hypothetical protein [Shewanella sp. VB17]
MGFSGHRLTIKFLSVVIFLGWLYSTALLAEEGVSKAVTATAGKQFEITELEQLQKARDAAGETQERENKILKNQGAGDWELEQKEKTQKQFNERGSREDKYLREAKEAATQKHKIPKS